MRRNEKVGFGTRLKGAIAGMKRGFYSMPVSEYLSGSGGLGFASSAGISVNATSAQKFSAVFACVRTYEQVMASLPIRVMSTESGHIKDLSTGPVYDLLHYPNKHLNRFTFFGLMNARVQLNGNAVAVIKHDKGMVPVELIPVEWSSVDVRVLNGEPIYIINDQVSGIKGTFMSYQVIHFKINSRNGYVGVSPISAARDAIGLGIAAENFGSDFFKKGGNLKGVLESEGHLSDKEFLGFKDRWDRFYTGAAGDHTAPILEYGMKYKSLGVAPNDAQFIETRVHQLQDVARFFGLPPSVIGENSRNTFSNGEQQDIQFVKYGLSPLCKMEEVELEMKLMDRNSQERLDIKFNMDGLLRGDMISRARYEQALVSAGVLTRNEAREIENRGPLEGLDEPLNPAFLTGKGTSNNQNSTKNE